MLDATNVLQWLMVALNCKIRVRKMFCPTS